MDQQHDHRRSDPRRGPQSRLDHAGGDHDAGIALAGRYRRGDRHCSRGRHPGRRGARRWVLLGGSHDAGRARPGRLHAGRATAAVGGGARADSPAAIYIREISRTPLLTAEEEIRLAQAREAGIEAATRLAAGWTTRRARSARSGGPRRRGRKDAPDRGEPSPRGVGGPQVHGPGTSRSSTWSRRGTSACSAASRSTTGVGGSASRPTPTGGSARPSPARSPNRVARSAAGPRRRAAQQAVHHRPTLRAQLGREPTPEEIAHTLGIDPDRVGEAFAAARVPISLDSPIGEDGNATIADLIADATARPAEEVEEEIFAPNLCGARQVPDAARSRRAAAPVRTRGRAERGRSWRSATSSE